MVESPRRRIPKFFWDSVERHGPASAECQGLELDMHVLAEALVEMAEDGRAAESVQAETWKIDFANQHSLLFVFNCLRGI